MATGPRSVKLMAVGAGLVVLVGLAGCVADSRSDLPAKSRSSSHKAPSSSAAGVPKGPQGPAEPGFRVTRVIDGDTVEVQNGPRVLTLRLIGIDTPETVHPNEPVECFGPAATRFAHDRLLGRDVTIEYDKSQGRHDTYGRTLAYVWVGNRSMRMFNHGAVRQGFALEYTYDTAYAWQSKFMRAERLARDLQRGVWRCPRPGS
jgi:micrococcal nuclease